MAQVKFLFGTLDQYKNLSTKDANSLYFITDTYEIYKGDQIYTRSYEVATNVSAVTSPKANYVYMFTDEKYLAEYKDGNWVELTARVADNLSNDSALPTTKAVRLAIEAVQKILAEQDKELQELSTDLETNVHPVLNDLTGEGENSVKAIATAAAAKFVTEALADPTGDFDTLQEIVQYLQADKTDSAELISTVDKLKEEVGLSDSTSTGDSLASRVNKLEETIGSADSGEGSLTGRLDAVEQTLEGIVSVGGEANLVNDVQVNGVSIVANKIANIQVSVNEQSPGHITIAGNDYKVADLGNYVEKDTYNEDKQTIQLSISNVQTSINTTINQLRTDMTAADEALSSRIDAIDGVSWNKL